MPLFLTNYDSGSLYDNKKVKHMKYRMYFLNKEFKDVIDEKILKELLELHNDEFGNKQMKYFLAKITKNEIISFLDSRFSTREDIILDDDIVIYKNQVTNKVAKMFFQDEIIVSCDELSNPLINEIKTEFNLLLIPMEK